ncbi:hypothetical protein ACX3V1_31945, partial [Escherichia coli]
MRYIAGIDIGNSSTEVALATLSATGELSLVSSALAETTGIKGTLRNVCLLYTSPSPRDIS